MRLPELSYHFNTNQRSWKQLGNAGRASYSIIHNKRAVRSLINSQWRHAGRRSAKLRNLAMKFHRISTLRTGVRQP